MVTEKLGAVGSRQEQSTTTIILIHGQAQAVRLRIPPVAQLICSISLRQYLPFLLPMEPILYSLQSIALMEVNPLVKQEQKAEVVTGVVVTILKVAPNPVILAELGSQALIIVTIHQPIEVDGLLLVLLLLYKEVMVLQ